jgi:hypothetical protein
MCVLRFGKACVIVRRVMTILESGHMLWGGGSPCTLHWHVHLALARAPWDSSPRASCTIHQFFGSMLSYEMWRRFARPGHHNSTDRSCSLLFMANRVRQA